MRPLPWLDRLKAVALGWVVLNHIVERVAGGAYAGNPSVPWPPLAVRLAQFQPVHGWGLFDWPLTVVRDLGWFGDQGVTLFLILSGAGLTYGLLARGAAPTLDVGDFYRRRAFRILPLWWGAHVLFLPLGIVTATMTPADWQFFASLAGLRFLPSAFYFFAPAWWYVGLLLQLYAVYPFLWRILRVHGAAALSAFGCTLGFGAIAAGPLLFHDAYLDAWQRGAFCMTRLPEFVLGMVLGACLHRTATGTEAFLRSPLTWLAGGALYVVGTAASFTLTGMIVAPLLLGAGAFALLFPFASAKHRNALAQRDATAGAAKDDVAQLIGRHSYSFYLTHQPMVAFLVPVSLDAPKIALGIVTALGASVVAAWLLERGTAAVESTIATGVRRHGGVATAAVAVAVLGATYGGALAADLAVQRFAPQEVLGWGERASLEPSARFGWNLIPSHTTRLRWESYDYRVTANALGFPGPQFSVLKPPNTARILVTGDAYSSAEGVDTALAWPRLLERDLNRVDGHDRVQVLNFAITGYGPQQEAAAVKAFAPRFHPDVVLVEMFVNDVQDVLTPNAAFRRSIGFGLPSQRGWEAVLGLRQLSAYLQLHVAGPLHSWLARKPDNEGYFLGNFLFLRRDQAQFDRLAVRRSIVDYDAIAQAARRIGATPIVAFIPAPVQVCGRAALAYYPRFVDLQDPRVFDLDLPEKRGREIAAAAKVRFWDLRPYLRALRPCPYMPRNMHFTQAGNAAVAAYLAQRLRPELVRAGSRAMLAPRGRGGRQRP